MKLLGLIDDYIVRKLSPLVAQFKQVGESKEEREERVEKAAEEAPAPLKSTFQGQIDEPIKVLVKCTGSLLINKDRTVLTKFRDFSGNIYVWFNIGDPEVVAGNIYDLSGKVYRHTKYRGVEETQIGKVKLDEMGWDR